MLDYYLCQESYVFSLVCWAVSYQDISDMRKQIKKKWKKKKYEICLFILTIYYVFLTYDS